mmetsp:Transcript_15310/g.36449  ORF Transcript_15310/g.36449 Transcript_15310/m.36449 type:complete len:206 (+) Transcript_15310:1652-2269(+)
MTASVALLAATMASQAITRWASAVPTLVQWMASGVLAIWIWLQVAPPFCARPAASCVMTPLPSRCAAMPSSWPMVMTPVPPTPATTMPQASSAFGMTGSGSAPSAASKGLLRPSFLGFLSSPPSTVTKLGQKPFTQEKSLLQVFWLIWRLRPKSVSSGSTDRQLDCTEQSPQPSHTSSLMTTRLAGSTSLPRLRRRRFSVAQVWS